MNKSYKNKFIRKIYRERDIKLIEDKINMLGDRRTFSAVSFMNSRLVTSTIVFLLVLYYSELGYVLAPIIAVVYYYIYYYIFITRNIKLRTAKLDKEALYFFEILTLTLESGRNLENALEVTVKNVDSELSREFEKTLFEIKFGKSLVESLHDMKKRIPSETINNIILSITQTNVFGNSIVATMYDQLDFLRDKQILEIKGQMAKLPNKISMVSVIFIVPLILMLILGPLLINFLG